MVGVLIRMKLAVLKHAFSSQRAAIMVIGALVGLGIAGATILIGLTEFATPAISTDLLAAMFLLWVLGWTVLPVIFGGGDDLLRPQHFRLLPVSARQLSGGLLVAALVGIPPVITFVGFSALVVQATKFGVLPVVVAVIGMVLQFAFVIVLAKVVGSALGAVLNSRRGRDVGMLVLVLFMCTGWLLRFPLQALMPRLVTGDAPGFALVVRWLPSGWASVAVEAAANSRWLLVIGPLAGLAAGTLLLIAVWASLLQRRMTTVPGGGSGGTKVSLDDLSTRRVLPATATGGVIGKEVRTWFRDIVRNVSLMGVVIACVFVALAPVVLGSTAILPYGGLIAIVIAAVLATNLYGLDGGSLWVTLVAPDAEKPDVRGRQWAWLLIIGPPAIVLTVVPTLIGGEIGAFPWVLSALPALLGGGAGLMVVLSVFTAYPMPDQRAGNPLAFRSRLSSAAAVGALAGIVLLALTVVPAGAVIVLGAINDLPAVQWLGVPVGLATGVLLFWWWGRVAYGRLQKRGPELLQLLRKAV